MTEILRDLFENEKCPLKAEVLMEKGISYNDLLSLEKKGIIKRFKNGYYVMPAVELSEEEIVTGLFTDGVFTMESALYFHGYIKEKPSVWSIAISKNTSKSRFKMDFPAVKVYYAEPTVLEEGVTQISRGIKNINVYDIDRLICEVLKYEDRVEKSVFKEAILSYIKDQEKDLKRLNKFANERRVLKKVNSIIAPWINEEIPVVKKEKKNVVGKESGNKKTEIKKLVEKKEIIKKEEKAVRKEFSSQEEEIAVNIYEIKTSWDRSQGVEIFGYIYGTLTEKCLDGKIVWSNLVKLFSTEKTDSNLKIKEKLENLKNDGELTKEWVFYAKRHNIMSVKWEKAINLIISFVDPVCASIAEDRAFVGEWMPGIGRFL